MSESRSKPSLSYMPIKILEIAEWRRGRDVASQWWRCCGGVDGIIIQIILKTHNLNHPNDRLLKAPHHKLKTYHLPHQPIHHHHLLHPLILPLLIKTNPPKFVNHWSTSKKLLETQI